MAKPFYRKLYPNANYITKNVEHFLTYTILVANIPDVFKIFYYACCHSFYKHVNRLLFIYFIYSLLIAYNFNNIVLFLCFHGLRLEGHVHFSASPPEMSRMTTGRP
jgi:hypothetical protein